MNTKKRIGAGILALDENTGKILLVKRSALVPNPNQWAVVGGKVDDDDENIQSAAIREFQEEVQPDDKYKISKLPFFINENKHLKFYTYLGIFENKFVPILNEENTEYGWFSFDELPENLLFACKIMFQKKNDMLKQIIEKIKK